MSCGQIVSSFLVGTYHAECSCGWRGEEQANSFAAELELADHACESATPGAVTPWGESYADLADAVLADRTAPPVLVLAAFLYQHGAEGELHNLIADAIAHERADFQRPAGGGA